MSGESGPRCDWKKGKKASPMSSYVEWGLSYFVIKILTFSPISNYKRSSLIMCNLNKIMENKYPNKDSVPNIEFFGIEQKMLPLIIIQIQQLG